MTVARFILAVAARLVPRDMRDSWREEWRAELWQLERRGGIVSRRAWPAIRFASGAIKHALTIRNLRRPVATNRRRMHMHHLFRDVRFALQVFRRSPGFALVIVLTVMLGIGATTSVFSVVDGVLLRPLPYPDAKELVLVGSSSSRFPGLAPVNPMDYFEWRRENTVFSHLSAVDSYTFDFIDGDQPVRIEGAAVTEEFFDLLGGRPLLGRTFRPGDDVATGERIVVLSHDLWQRRFGGDPTVLGRRIFTADHGYTIVGVMSPGFRHPGAFWAQNVELWMPLSFIDNPLDSRGARFLQVIGRLRRDVTIHQARVEMDGISIGLAEQYPENVERMAMIESLQDETVGDIGESLYMLLGAVGLLLAITCVNIANLLLARATQRSREMALRRALGAKSGRIYQQLLTEGVVLALVGGVLGVAVSYAAVQAFRSLDPVNLPRITDVAVDLRIMTVAVLLSAGTGILFTLMPALRLARTETTEALKEGGRGTDGSSGSALRHGLVAAEIALAMVLVIGAGLLARSFVNLRSVDPGFDADNVVTLTLNLGGGYDTDRRVQHLEMLIERFRTIPGVAAVGYASSLPFSGDRWLTGYQLEGQETNPDNPSVADYTRVSAGFFKTMGMDMVEGREFSETDDGGHDNVMVVNETFARESWPGQSAVGQRVGSRGRDSATWYTVIGVVNDVSRNNLDAPADPEFYFSALQRSTATAQFAVRVMESAESVIGAMRSHAWELDPIMPLTFDMMEQALVEATARPRFQTTLLTVFAGIALFLAAIGVYGTMAYNVGRRRHEIGIRMALGASGGEVVQMVVRQAAVVTAIGLVTGVAGSMILSRAIDGMLFGVSSNDLGTYLVATICLSSVALVASLVPALRAGRDSPLVALRTE